MAGYFVVLGDIKDENQKIIKSAKNILFDMCRCGVYSTNLFVKDGAQKWSKPKVATFGDYFGMKKDDYIFFFFGRKIYGVGKLVKMAAEKGRATRPNIKLGICGEHGGEPSSVEFCHNVGLTYVSCSPFRVPIARLAAAQAALKNK